MYNRLNESGYNLQIPVYREANGNERSRLSIYIKKQNEPGAMIDCEQKYRGQCRYRGGHKRIPLLKVKCNGKYI